MIRDLGKNRLLWFLVALLSWIVALIGVIRPGIYSRVVSAEIMHGVLAQDLMTILAATVVLLALIRIREQDLAKQVVILGIVGYLFYAYGIYVIERLYNVLYLGYMAIFSLSFYALIYRISDIRRETTPKIRVSNPIRWTSVGFSLLNPILFGILWIGQLLPLIRSGEKIEFLYSVYILDLCFIMPLFVIVAIKTARNEAFGLLLTPAMFVLGFTLLAPLSIAEALKPVVYHLPADPASIWLFAGISGLFLVLAFVYLWNLRTEGEWERQTSNRDGKGDA
jgi:hypothetical protein